VIFEGIDAAPFLSLPNVAFVRLKHGTYRVEFLYVPAGFGFGFGSDIDLIAKLTRAVQNSRRSPIAVARRALRQAISSSIPIATSALLNQQQNTFAPTRRLASKPAHPKNIL
jgi:hypothetical protein